MFQLLPFHRFRTKRIGAPQPLLQRLLVLCRRTSPTWLKRSVKRIAPGEHVRFATSFSDLQWSRFLTAEVHRVVAEGAAAVVVLSRPGEEDGSRLALRKRLAQHPAVVADLEVDPAGSGAPSLRTLLTSEVQDQLRGSKVAFVACSTRNADVQGWLRLVLGDEEYEKGEFLFKIRPSDSMGAAASHAGEFVSSRFDDDLLRDAYSFSLTKVSAKYDIRDAYDLLQALLSTESVPGAVVEFGSYRGHSGLILSEVMAKLKLGKPLFLCDMFEEFPLEDKGVDKVWNDSHHVDFSSVQELFRPYGFVTLVKGDFEQTLATLPVEQLSMVHVDCDSYRAVQLVTEFAFPRLSSGGVLVYEDYGHDFCLGGRAAVDDFYRARGDCFRFFSAFSGLELVVKR